MYDLVKQEYREPPLFWRHSQKSAHIPGLDRIDGTTDAQSSGSGLSHGNNGILSLEQRTLNQMKLIPSLRWLSGGTSVFGIPVFTARRVEIMRYRYRHSATTRHTVYANDPYPPSLYF